MTPFTTSAAARYDRALHLARESRLPPEYPSPRPTTEWSDENIALLEQYRDWLFVGGMSLDVINVLYVPTAGHVLGLALKPPDQLDLDADLQRAFDYVKAKRLSATWSDNTRIALDKFRQFLCQQRGQMTVAVRLKGRERYVAGLPDWLVEQLERYHHLRRSHWRPARADQGSLRFWSAHTAIWRWVTERRAITSPLDVKRQDVLDYVDHCLVAGWAASTINYHLRTFHAFLLYLQEQDFRVPQALLRIPCLKQPDRLPRFLTDEQVRQLRADFEQRVTEARFAAQRRDALLDRAAFYLMWQGGLRLGEVEELRLEDLDLANRKLMVRQGKGQKDRAIYLTDTAIHAVQEYVTVRGQGEDDHLFLYHHLPVCRDLLRDRIKAAGQRVGVKVTPYQLRHSCATLLLNAGAPILTVQTILGHRHIDTTLGYARLYDGTVAADYYRAMLQVERQMILPEDAVAEPPSSGQLLALVDSLRGGTLNDSQQEAVRALRAGITALAERGSALLDSERQIA